MSTRRCLHDLMTIIVAIHDNCSFYSHFEFQDTVIYNSIIK